MDSLPPRQQLVAPGKWPLVGERQPRNDPRPWLLEVCGQVAHPMRFTLDELQACPTVTRAVDIHCVTRWSKLDVAFTGVPLAAVLHKCSPLPGARFVSFVARSERDHSTSLPLTDALSLETLLVWAANAAPLETCHGGPLRVVVPGRYFYKSLKWLTRIELLAEDRLGYWEAETGYHNVADPWQEQRYMAPTLSKQEASALIANRDFSGRDLRSIDASGRDLAGLNARQALLRDANFSKCNLQRACFDGANLSNANLDGADLRKASFRGGDVEGASFAGADLRGADFSGASLFGATFCHELQPLRAARIDRSTRISPDQLEALTPVQMEFVHRSLSNALDPTAPTT